MIGQQDNLPIVLMSYLYCEFCLMVRHGKLEWTQHFWFQIQRTKYIQRKWYANEMKMVFILRQTASSFISFKCFLKLHATMIDASAFKLCFYFRIKTRAIQAHISSEFVSWNGIPFNFHLNIFVFMIFERDPTEKKVNENDKWYGFRRIFF